MYFKAFVLLITVFIISCTPSQQGTSVEASEQEAGIILNDSAEIAVVDTLMSVITWIGSKPTGKHNGIIRITAGTVAIQADTVASGAITINLTSLRVMDMDSSGNNKLTRHLLSKDFFDTENHPMGQFEVSHITPYDSMQIITKEEFVTENTPALLKAFMVRNPTHLISGNLTLRGITKNITFPAEINVSPSKVKMEAKFNIDRTDWNLSYRSEAKAVDKAKDKFIYNTVNVGFNLEALRSNQQ